MATSSLSLHSSLICAYSSVRYKLTPASFSPFLLFLRRPRWNSLRQIRSMSPDLLGDFGARDPFPAEIESNFGENVVGNEGTEHRILIPNLSSLSLAQRSCEPVSSLQLPLSKKDAEKLLKKVRILFPKIRV